MRRTLSSHARCRPVAFEKLNAQQVPYMFLTNGTGTTEAEKCKVLEKILGIPVPINQMVRRPAGIVGWSLQDQSRMLALNRAVRFFAQRRSESWLLAISTMLSSLSPTHTRMPCGAQSASTAAFPCSLMRTGNGSLAKDLNFEKVVSVQDFAAANPLQCPAMHYTPEQVAEARTRMGALLGEPVAAIAAFQAPGNWYEAMQVCVDLLRSNGRPGRANEVR
jgi:hypothetical protein